MKILFLLFLILISSYHVNAQDHDVITIGIIDSIYSEALREQRKIWIYLPESFDKSSDSKYPVLYLLDGETYFYSLSGIVKQLSSFGTTSCPESIIVAIPNSDRSRDLTPYDPETKTPDSSGIEKFTRFLKEELIPFVDKKYSTLPHRTLIGHSLGGSFVIHALINHQNLFTNYLAIDPGLKSHNYRFFNYALEKLKENKYNDISLFLTVANTMPENMDTIAVLKDTTDMTSTIRSNLNFAKTLNQFTKNDLAYKWKYYSDENHLSIPTISQYDGLRFFFRWNTLDLDKIIRTNPNISAHVFFKKAISHYQHISEILDHTTLAKQDQMNDLGYYYLQKNDFEGARLFFAFNVKHYPTYSNPYDSMGDYYLAIDNQNKAAEYFLKAIEIDGNPYSKLKLKKLSDGGPKN